MQRETVPGRVGRRLVRALDARLRRSQGISVFSEDADCILRLSVTTAAAPMSFSDGTSIAPGDPLVVLHFWNERMPAMPPAGPDLRWARQMYRQVVASLRLLARYLETRPDLAGVRAFGSDVAGFLTGSDLDTGGVFSRLGFQVERPHARAGAWGRFVEFWENTYSWALVWTYNPASVRGKTPWTLEHFSLWITKATLEQRYGRDAAVQQREPGPAAEPALATESPR